MRGQHVVARAVLDVEEFILGRDLGNRQHLQAVFLAAWCIQKQVAEVARPFAVAHGLAQLVHVVDVAGRVGHVEDKAGMGAVEVVAPVEEREGPSNISPAGIGLQGPLCMMLPASSSPLFDVRANSPNYDWQQLFQRTFR